MSDATAMPVATGEALSLPVGDEAPQVPPKHRVKIDQEEIEVDYDELVRGYQKGRSADKRYQEAARMKKDSDEQREAFAKGDFKALSERWGISQSDLRQKSEDYLIELLKFEQLPEAEKRALIAERKADELQSKLDTDKASREQQEADLVANQAAEFIDSALGDAIKASGQKVTPVTVARIAAFLQAAISQDGAEVNEASVRKAAEGAVKRAATTLDEEIRTRFSDITVADAKAILPKRLLDELRKASVEEVLSQDPKWSRKAPEKGNSQPKAEQKLSIDDWFAERAKHLG